MAGVLGIRSAVYRIRAARLEPSSCPKRRPSHGGEIMNASLKWTLLPRRGSKLRVLIVVRISTVHQDPRSLDDQIALCQQYVRNLYQGEIEFIVIRSQGSGEIL